MDIAQTTTGLAKEEFYRENPGTIDLMITDGCTIVHKNGGTELKILQKGEDAHSIRHALLEGRKLRNKAYSRNSVRGADPERYPTASWRILFQFDLQESFIENNAELDTKNNKSKPYMLQNISPERTPENDREWDLIAENSRELDRVRREIPEEHKKVTNTSAVFEYDTVTKRRKPCVPVLTEEIFKEIIGRSTNQVVKDLLLRFLDPEDNKDSTPVLRKAICIGLFFNSVGGHVSAWWVAFVVALGFGCSKTPDYFGEKQLLFFWENIHSFGLIGSTLRTKFIAEFRLVHCGYDGSAFP
jgi:hypothetical protein